MYNYIVKIIKGLIIKSTILLTSNPNKLKEFQKYIPEMTSEIGEDIKEVNGSSDDVIIYKALSVPKGRMVEDTILTVNGVEVVDIRYTGNDAIKEGDTLVWSVKLGYNSGDEIQVFSGAIKGKAVFDRRAEHAFGFDDIFLPLGSDKTLFELGEDKENFSARKMAINNYIANVTTFAFPINSVPEWTGTYQND